MSPTPALAPPLCYVITAADTTPLVVDWGTRRNRFVRNLHIEDVVALRPALWAHILPEMPTGMVWHNSGPAPGELPTATRLS